MQVTLYRCGLCNNHDFDRPFKVERHMDEQHSNFGYMCPECRRVFLRRDSKHKNCRMGEQGGKNLEFVSRNNYQYGEEEKEQYNKFKRESRKLVITIENNTQPIVPTDLTEKKERKEKEKKKRNKSHDKENKYSGVAERKRKHSPERARSVTPVPESRVIIIKPKNRITAPPQSTYVPTLSPPTCTRIPDIISPIKSVPNSPKVQQKSPSVGTICLDEPIIGSSNTETNCDDCIINSPKVKAKSISSASVKSVNEEDTCISIFAADEYIPASNTNEIEATYEPTPKHILQLKSMAECQKSRIILNVGGSRFETCVPTLQSDPSSILSYMVLKDSPMKPYSVDNIYTYFLDRDPRHFVHILNYLRSSCNSDLSTFPRTIIALRELQRECNFYHLTHLHCLLEKRIVDILQGHLQD